MSLIVGVADHCGWAILVTVGPDRRLHDRRRVQLVEDGLPWLPHHHQAQTLPRDEGVALVERVRRSADACARACLEALATALPLEVAGIALRRCPPLPATIAERISSYRAQTMADGVLYREALAQAASARGWSVHWYDPRRVLTGEIETVLERTGRTLGPPWRKDHRLAMAAAIAASARG